MKRIRSAAAMLLCTGALAACHDRAPTTLEAPAERTSADLAPSEAAVLPGASALEAAPPFSGTAVAVGGSGNLEPALAQIRSLLGEPLNTTPGPHAGGRREINWDGVPAALTNTNDFPGDFFNSTDPGAPAGRKRGAIFTTPGTGFRISDNDFADVNPSYADHFRFFSPIRTFIQIGSRVMDVHFRVPGTDIPAVVNGFAVVFSDVDRLSSSLIFYDVNDQLIGAMPAPRRSDANGHSVVAVIFDRPIIARVRIVSGERPIGPRVRDVKAGGRHDLVVTDDFLYGEPQPIP